MKFGNAIIVDQSGTHALRLGCQYAVQGPAYIRIEPEFLFDRRLVHIRILGKDGVRLFDQERCIDRGTIALFQPLPRLPLGQAVLQLWLDTSLENEIVLDVLWPASSLLNVAMSERAQSEFYRRRGLVQALPFEKMLKLTRRKLDEAGAKLVFITGSVGKTSTKEVLSFSMQQHAHFIKSTDSWNFPHEICSQILNNIGWCRLFIMEAALGNHLELMGECLPPDIFVYVTVGEAHTSFSSAVSDIARQKGCLGKFMSTGSTIVANFTNQYVKEAINALNVVASSRVNVISISDGEDSTVQVLARGQEIRLRAFGKEARLSNAPWFLNPIVVGCAFGAWNALTSNTNCEHFLESIANCPPIPGRLDVRTWGTKVFINDAYNANPISMRRFIEVLSHYSSLNSRVLAVVGEMGDLGDLSADAHIRVAKTVLGVASKVLFLGQQYEALDFSEFKGGELVSSYEQLEALIARYLPEHDVIAVKGSHSTGLLKLAMNLSGGENMGL